MRKPQPLTAKPIRIPKTVFTSPHPQKTWSTLFWSLFHLPPYRDIKSREPLKHLHAHKIWGPSDLHLPHSAPYQRLVTWKYSHGLQHPSIILWQRAHHPHHEWLLSLKRMPPRRTSLSFSSVFLAGTVNALMDEKYEGEDWGGGGGPCVRIFSFLCYFDRKTWFMSSLMCGLGSLCRCILRTVTGSFVPVGDGGGGVARVWEFCAIRCHWDLLSLNKSILTNPVTLSWGPGSERVGGLLIKRTGCLGSS